MLRSIVFIFILLSIFPFQLSAQATKRPGRVTPRTTLPVRPLAYDVRQFDPSTEKLPPHYKGHNPALLFAALETRPGADEKVEYETTAEYNRRIQIANSKVIFGELTIHSTFAIVVPKITTSYDADSGILNAFVRLDGKVLQSPDEIVQRKGPEPKGVELSVSTLNRRTYVGTTAFGVKKQIRYGELAYLALAFSNWDLFYPVAIPDEITSFVGGTDDALRSQLSVNPEAAARIRAGLSVVLLFRPSSPYVETRRSHYEPTIARPTEVVADYNTIFGELIGYWLFNSATGEVYEKKDKFAAFASFFGLTADAAKKEVSYWNNLKPTCKEKIDKLFSAYLSRQPFSLSMDSAFDYHNDLVMARNSPETDKLLDALPDSLFRNKVLDYRDIVADFGAYLSAVGYGFLPKPPPNAKEVARRIEAKYRLSTTGVMEDDVKRLAVILGERAKNDLLFAKHVWNLANRTEKEFNPGVAECDHSNDDNNSQMTIDSSPAESASPKSPQLKTEGGMIVSRPHAAYAPAARKAGAVGEVRVVIEIDEGGNVISAEAVSGHPLLKSSSEEAAMRAKFSPKLLNGKPIRWKASLVFTYSKY